MTINVPPHYDDFHATVILNGNKNALWERREAATWHGVKNLWLGWHLAVFLTTAADPSLALVLLSKSSKVLDHMLRKGYTAYSEWHLTAFLTTGTDPSHSFRMTINISLIMMTSMPRSFWMETRMLCGKDGKRQHDTEWRIYDSDDILPSSSLQQQILRLRSYY